MTNDSQKHIDDIDRNNQSNTFQTGELPTVFISYS